ncbi:CubicO group peptidase (beta-lactamase class C family) [Mucilaginibacter gracilis]|uniref:CubicO group peptidase (Beta-lactamase class C family) n=2 Tax=Mucilaginibacter gracilis TaxID=423350 RepID=A0A495J0S0_9SPHI|nr:CubicO group peptidase (beta-lactamase class C family) [Mucilaginibacter gracilis]
MLTRLGYACAQQPFTKVNQWLDVHVSNMGGRVILMVYHNGKIVYTHSVNQMDMLQKMATKFMAKKQGQTADLDDYSPSSRQAIASCSKWLSAALVMTFVDEGKLQLTDTVGKFIPILSKNGKGKITIGQCLSHQTGIMAASLKDDLAEMRSISTMDEAMQYIAQLPMEGEPGKVFRYSNVGLQIAGAVIEKIGGKSFKTLFAERIAKPLNMKNTDYGTGKVPLPAGSGISTPEDYMNFLVMILNKGTFNGRRILSEASIAQMQMNRVTPDVKVAYSPTEAGGFGYGYGEWTMEKGAVTSPGLFGSFPWVDYNKGYAAFMMTFYIKNDGRNQRYKELKALVDEAVK